MTDDSGDKRLGPEATAFLLSQVGAWSAACFAERIAPLGIAPPHAGIMHILGKSPGLSQRALAALLGMLPSRLVVLVDEMEAKGLVERRSDPEDRRTHALHLTAAGGAALDAVHAVGREHDAAICAALTPEEKRLLTAFLSRIAADQGLTIGVHPGYRTMGRGGGPCPSE